MATPIPPYEQVRRDILEQVRTGELRPGDRLPAIRALAGDLSMAPGTVARAYKLLEAEQIILTRRGAGTTVAPDAVAASERSAASTRRDTAAADPQLVELLAPAVEEARRAGHGELAILASVREVLSARPAAADGPDRDPA